MAKQGLRAALVLALARSFGTGRGSLIFGLVLGAAVVLVSAFLLSVERQIPRARTETVRGAQAVLNQSARLQTGARQCTSLYPTFLTLYNKYVRRHGAEIQLAVEQLSGLDARQAVRRGAVHVQLARTLDRAYLEARLDSASFCQSSFADLQTILMRVPAGALTRFALSGGTPVETRLAARNP